MTKKKSQAKRADAAADSPHTASPDDQAGVPASTLAAPEQSRGAGVVTVGAECGVLKYVARQIDDQLTYFLEEDSEYTRVAILFCPPWTGKTRAVTEAAKRKEFALHRIDNGALARLVQQMVADGSGTYQTFRSKMARNFQSKMLGIRAEGKVLLHLDEVQAHIDGIDKFREDGFTFDFDSPPDAAQLAALIHCLRLMCDDRVRLVVSGTAVNATHIAKLGSEDKCWPLTILPTNPKEVKRVLMSQEPSMTVTDEQATELCGSIGQLHCVYQEFLAYPNQDPNKTLENAFDTWYALSQQQQKWELHHVLRAVYLIAQLPSPEPGQRFVPLKDLFNKSLAETPAAKMLQKSGAWVTVQHVDGQLQLLWPTPWQSRALDLVFAEAAAPVRDAFLVQGAAACTGEKKQKGFVFQCMFLLELCRLKSPLWKVMEEQQVAFSRIERFDKDQNWAPGVLYAVHGSSREKAGDIVWRRADGGVVCLELKCGSEEYVTSEFKAYTKALLRAPMGAGAKPIFVSCDKADYLEKVLRHKQPGRSQVIEPCSRIVNGARNLDGLHYQLHPPFSKDVGGFADAITRSASASAVVSSAVAAAVFPGGTDTEAVAARPRKLNRVEGPPPCHVIVTLRDGTTREFNVGDGLRERTIDGLRRAVLADLDEAERRGLTVAALDVFPPGAERGPTPIDHGFARLEPTSPEAPYHVTIAGAWPRLFPCVIC